MGETGQDRAVAVVAALGLFFGSGALVAFHCDLVLRSPELAPAVPLSAELHATLARRLPSFALFLALPVGTLFVGLAVAVYGLARRLPPATMVRYALLSGALAFPLTVFDALWLTFRPSQQNGVLTFLFFVLPLLHEVVPAAWLAALVAFFWRSRDEEGFRRPVAVAALIALVLVYAAVFSALSILQYAALMVPHGDTAMYEEHLWNLVHGKGFRSQLDGGRLFLGEHIEFIHVFLIPIYVLYPCLPTLNVLYSLALGLGAIPVYGLARAAGASRTTALLVAGAYLLYPPLEYLNIEASLKTFRPENLAVPLILASLWAVEKRRYKLAAGLWLLALTGKEDYAIPLAALGVFLALRRGQAWRQRVVGAAVAVFGLAYLWLAVAVLIPFFRGGPPHYMAYYPSLGHSPAEVLQTAVREPEKVAALLWSPDNARLLAMLLVPLAGLPLLAPARLAVALPSFVPLLLGELPGLKQPLFHFHAPLVPLLFWAVAGSFRRHSIRGRQHAVGMLVAALCLAANVWWGKSPLSINFWDPHAGLLGYYGVLYVPGERVERFSRFYDAIPLSASVAATDYVRPRFTHHRECHEIGASGLKPHVRPEQVDYLVVDLRGPYSDPQAGRRVPESIHRPGGWETVYEDDYFLVVRARQR